MVELIIVILVVGILALIALPKVKEDHLYELVDQTVALIRYTQQLAMQDNPYDPADPHWFKKRWTIQIAKCPSPSLPIGSGGITIFKETNPGGPSRPVFAKDPANSNKVIYAGYMDFIAGANRCDVNLYNKKYNYAFSGLYVAPGFFAGLRTSGCAHQSTGKAELSFDEFGRPHFRDITRPYGGDRRLAGCSEVNGYKYKRFRITFMGRKQYANIYIEGETGFVHVRYHDNPPGGYDFGAWDINGY